MPPGSSRNQQPEHNYSIPATPNTEPEPGMVEQPWVLRGPASRVYVMSFAVALGVFLLTTLMHFIIVPKAATLTRQPLADLLSALLIGFFAYSSYIRRRERMQWVFSRIRMVAELNHHVRNALQTITLRIYSTGDQKLIDDVSGATHRIDWALREILGSKGPRPEGEES
jgi:hypothetical protein